MNPIQFPLTRRMTGANVADLHAVLQILLDRALIAANDPDTRQGLIQAMPRDATAQLYGSATGKAVAIFQAERGIASSGEVDEATAAAFNEFIRSLGDLGVTASERVVSGKISREDGIAMAGMRVRAFHEERDGAIRLGEDVTDGEGRYTIRYALVPGVTSIDLRVTVSGEDGETLQRSDVVRAAAALLRIDLVVPVTDENGAARRVEGRVVLDYGEAAENVTLRLYRRAFGGQATLLSEGVTRAHGVYALPYVANGRESLEVRALDATGAEVPLSTLVRDEGAEERTVVNLVAPATLRPLAAEFDRLATSLTPHVGQMAELSKAKENADQQDLTLLNRASGWDARLIALAANAATLASSTSVSLGQDELYGLFRAGLPTDPLQLAGVRGDVAELALKKVAEAGVVAIDAQRLATVKQRFESFATATRLAIPTPGSRSTYGEMLQTAAVSDATRARFASLYLDHTGDAKELWQKAADAGVTADEVKALQRQGKLAFLTLNSQPMTQRLQQQLEVAEPVQLVDRDLDLPDNWKNEVRAMANNDPQQLAAIIPPAYSGETVDARLDAYAEDMARKVRVSYPTPVVARMVERDADDTFQLGAARAPTVMLLRNASKQGFNLGQTPVESFARDNPGIFDGIAPDDVAGAKEGAKTLQRLYQLSPGNDSMTALMKAGLTSAFDITALSQEEFLGRYEHLFPSVEHARLVYRKAQQVQSVTMNLYGIVKEMDSAPPVAAVSPPAHVKELAKNELIKHYPTMEALFGSLDFCECEHCRSVLSPAAYLVDLLQFVDPEPAKWNGFLAKWKAEHGGEEYTATYKRPFDALVERRPDIPHIPLTCENTQTAMPYIDVVNEILEFYVANDKLTEAAARDTGDATTPELLAEPQNIIPAAYDTLLAARYPLALPFDLWLETVRRLCDHFETPLAQVMETFRRTDALVDAAQPYDRTRIFIESLGISPAEYALFTDPDPLAAWFTLYGFATAADALTPAADAGSGQRIDLNSAKALSRRLGVTYKELTEIVSTGFVNPKLESLVVLYKLGVSVRDVLFYEEHRPLLGGDPDVMDADDLQRRAEVEAFVKRLEEATAKYAAAGFDARQWVDDALTADTFDDILVLADPQQGCNFDETTLRYADAQPCDAIAFTRINLFVRLWRKLGWTIGETDRALQAFVPSAAPYDVANAAKRPLATALVHLAHLRALEGELRAGKRTREKLLALWTPIAATGRNPLYAELFLGRSVLQNDPVFDHPLGQYLTTPGIPLRDHVLALQGALGLTAADITRIVEASGADLATAELTMANVSLLYRHALLAKALKLTIPDLIALRDLSGLDPFAPIAVQPLATLADDVPYAQTSAFVRVARTVKESGLRIEELEYLLRHRFDPAGRFSPDVETMLARVKGLSDGIRAIRTLHAVPADTGALDDEALRQKLALALPADVVARLASMMAGTVEVTVTTGGVAPADALNTAMFAGVDEVRQAAYNAARQEQALTWRGVLFDAQKAALKARFPSPVFGRLLDAVQGEGQSFFARWLLKQPPGTKPESGFLQAADFDLLFAPIPDGLTPEQQQARLSDRRGALARSFLPYLQQRLVRDLVVRGMATETGGDPELVDALVTEPALLGDPAALLDAFTEAGVRGVDATFFASPDLTGAALASVTMGDTDTASRDAAGTPLMPNAARSARIEGYLEVPTPGAYRFHIVLDKAAAVAELRFAHLPAPLAGGTAAADGGEVSEFTVLKAGVPYAFTLELRNLGGGGARVLVQGETMPRDRMSRLTLYPRAAVERVDRASILLAKSLRIITALELTEREVRHILGHPADFGGVSLSALPARGDDDSLAGARALFAQWLRLAGYTRLKREMAGGGDELVDAFAAPAVDGAYDVIARLTRREAADVKATAEAIFAAPSLKSELAVQRVWEALQLVERFGIPVDALAKSAAIVNPALAQADRRALAKGLKEAVRARFDQETWQAVAQPIFDALRRRQRDALAAHVMHQHAFGTIEQLYEYFLIDPGMEPVVQTSRIRLALASVQLFIQRSLLNLERFVHPSVINAGQWEWMKRYRVWEANRKIFLFPENWLEPEFRDDKTHLFTEMESALLQGDISNDAAEDAFLAYLQKLETMARLEIVGLHVQDDADATLNTLHVIGRTYSQPYEFYYRRFSNRMWTPWEPMGVELEGNHIAPVFWRDRLYLFWVTFTEQGASPDFPGGSSGVVLQPATKVSSALTTVGGGSASATLGVYDKLNSGGSSSKKLTEVSVGDIASSIGGASQSKYVQAHLHWAEYLKGEWTPRKTGAPDAVLRARVPSTFDSNSVFVHVSVQHDDEGEERGVLVHLGGSFNRAFHLAGRNSVPESASRGAPPDTPYPNDGVRANRYRGSGALRVTFTNRITTEDGKPPVSTSVTSSILQQGGVFTILPADNAITLVNAEVAKMVTPFFYQDNSEQTFFVEPSFTEKTIEQWEEWVTRTPVPNYDWTLTDEFWKEHVIPAVPKTRPVIPIDPRDPIWTPKLGAESRFKEKVTGDWLLNESTALTYGGEIIGPGGRAPVQVLSRPALGAALDVGVLNGNGNGNGARRVNDVAVDLEPGGGLADRGVVLAADRSALENAGLSVGAAGTLRVVGSQGLNSALRRGFSAAGHIGGI